MELGAPCKTRTCDLLVRRLMQVPGLVVLRVCSSVRTTLLPSVREQIVHLLFTAIVVQLLGGHPMPQVTDLYSRLPFGIASRVANTPYWTTLKIRPWACPTEC